MKKLSKKEMTQAFKQHFATIATMGGTARAAALTPERRKEIARNAAKARWEGKPK